MDLEWPWMDLRKSRAPTWRIKGHISGALFSLEPRRARQESLAPYEYSPSPHDVGGQGGKTGKLAQCSLSTAKATHSQKSVSCIPVVYQLLTS